MITQICPSPKMKKTIQNYLRDIMAKIPMTLEIHGSSNTRKKSVSIPKKREPRRYLYSDGAFGGVVFNTALSFQDLPTLEPVRIWLHASDARIPDLIPALEALYGHKSSRQRLNKRRSPKPDHNPRSQE